MIELYDAPSVRRENKQNVAGIAGWSFIISAMIFPIMVQLIDGSQPVSYDEKFFSWTLSGALGIFGIWTVLKGHALRAKPGEDEIPLTEEDAVRLYKRIQILGAEKELRAHVQQFGEVRYSNLPALYDAIRARAAHSARAATSQVQSRAGEHRARRPGRPHPQ